MGDEPPGYHEVTGSTSATPPPQEKPSSKYALLSISWTDRIRLMRFPDDPASRVLEILRTSWPKGIQDVKPFDETVEIKLRGNPFAHGMDEEKIAIRKVLLAILETLAKDGWSVMPAGGLGRIGNHGPHGEKGVSGENQDALITRKFLRNTDKNVDSVVFQQQHPQDLSLFCISFDSSNLMHLINAPSHLARSIIDTFGDKIETCNQDLVSNNFEIKFKDNPFAQPTKKGALQARLVVLQMLQCLDENGFKLYTSLDIDNGTGGVKYSSSAEVWFCCHS